MWQEYQLCKNATSLQGQNRHNPNSDCNSSILVSYGFLTFSQISLQSFIDHTHDVLVLQPVSPSQLRHKHEDGEPRREKEQDLDRRWNPASDVLKSSITRNTRRATLEVLKKKLKNILTFISTTILRGFWVWFKRRLRPFHARAVWHCSDMPERKVMSADKHRRIF